MKKRFLFILFWIVLALFWLPLCAESQHGHKSASKSSASGTSGTEEKPAYPSMPGPGQKISIGDDYYFTYGFDKALKMGMVIMKVQLYNKKGEKETSLEVLVDSGMPSMKGYHETGDRRFKVSKNGDYLQPIDIVMRGGWEIKLTILKGGKVLFRGSYEFNV